MPNWCDNRMILRNNNVAKINALEEELSKKNAEGRSMAEPFQHLCPNPTGEWDYGWSATNWGTKWDADIIDWERNDPNEITLYCNTAWSPPIALYEHLTEEGWIVDAVYHECGMCFAGTYTSENGDDCYEYDRTDKDSMDNLPSEVMDFAGLEDAHEEWKAEAIDDYMAHEDRTEWYPTKIKPAYVGRYEVITKAWAFPQYCEWTGEKWERWSGDEIKVDKWRGLTEEFTDAKYQEMIDNIAESN
jgi:hypothetical protein